MAPRMATTKKPSVDDAKKLTGPEKAAVILLSLGEEHTQLWKNLDDEEIKEISQAMAGLGTVSASVVEELLMEFVSGMSGSGAVMGSFEQTQRLLAAFMPADRVDGLMEEIRGPAGRTMWDKLGNVNEAVLANYLKNEYPQTVAVVLSKVKPDHAARVLTSPCPRTSPWNASSGCCAWSRSSARSSTRSNRPCASSSCPTWPARPSATATR
jgi:flagellar motor switch protein FliG